MPQLTAITSAPKDKHIHEVLLNYEDHCEQIHRSLYIVTTECRLHTNSVMFAHFCLDYKYFT